MHRLVEMIQSSSYCVAFTGAGVSTLAGISDFRGKQGLYKQEDIDADRIFDIGYFRKDPSYYYLKSKDFIYNLDKKTPALVHTELARLEEAGYIKAVITQNIDLLHQKAGSKRVIEVHGSPGIHRCLSCGRTWDFADIAALVQQGTVPFCDDCGGIIKPDITFFGEQLPAQALEEAFSLAASADLMIILGSTLLVQPAASIPLYTRRNNGNLVIVNNMETPLDPYAALRYSDLGEVFSYLGEHLV
ncbi:MAG: NAD-dependent deacetylase [Spirochaetales bacterium]|nr:NAD-dependent deacetylase [Spirochaetales bacterium]